LIDEVLETFKIKRSLSTKGCPYDNAVAEATMKAMKTEFGICFTNSVFIAFIVASATALS
jgi:transposase InsO family protein